MFIDGDQQRSLHSEYYSECCGKGGAYIQLCGWIRSGNLVAGHAADAQAAQLAKILEQQEAFQEHDKQNPAGQAKSFLIALGKGYRLAMIAKNHSQQTLQPSSGALEHAWEPPAWGCHAGTYRVVLLSSGSAAARSYGCSAGPCWVAAAPMRCALRRAGTA